MMFQLVLRLTGVKGSVGARALRSLYVSIYISVEWLQNNSKHCILVLGVLVLVGVESLD